ncbi:hypothetical protein HPB50_020767 [Hyalomma asiaticum]|uniref:Uncharacterized protein n=1 Tax=Hyalomma asiaticum TaxID=266040 RepID=A0ACB7RNU7_HYAAI|nr:hypothetical protein HPB50_020767 [Hyalomma asiaticum]
MRRLWRLQIKSSPVTIRKRTQQWPQGTRGLLQPNNTRRVALNMHKARNRRASPRSMPSNSKDASVGLAVWPIWDQTMLVYMLRSVDAEHLLRDVTLPVGGRQLPSREHPQLTSWPLHKLPGLGNCYYFWRSNRRLMHSELPLLQQWPHDWSYRLCWVVPEAYQIGMPTRIQAEGNGRRGHKQAPTPNTGPKKAQPAEPNKPGPKQAHTALRLSKVCDPIEASCLMVNDFSPLTRVQAHVSCWGGAVSGPFPSPSPIETALQKQMEGLRHQNDILACIIQELEANKVGSSKLVQGPEVEDYHGGSTITSCLTSDSRHHTNTVFQSVSTTGPVGHPESLQCETEQLEEGWEPSPIKSFRDVPVDTLAEMADRVADYSQEHSLNAVTTPPPSTAADPALASIENRLDALVRCFDDFVPAHR